MNKLGQFGIILLILSLGEILQRHFQLPIPATVIGMMILLLLLVTKVLRLSWIEGISKVLLDNIGLLFVPAGVGIMNKFPLLKNNIFELMVIIFITTILVMLTTGYTIQILMNSRKK